MAAFDHLAVSAVDLEDGVAAVEAALGVPLAPGGRHDFMGTHNRVMSLGPHEYLEVIAIDPDAPRPSHARWFGLDQFSGAARLTNWILRVEDLDEALAAAPMGAGHATDLARGDYRWRFAVPATGHLPFDDTFPALIEWQSAHPAAHLPDQGCRMTRLEIAHPDAEALRAILPLTDPRIAFVSGARAMRATIATPNGTRMLQ